jgi:hypothetical protein
MTKPTVDELLAAESQLNRSLIAAVVGLLANLGWSIFMAKTSEPGGRDLLIWSAFFLLQVGGYVWFAVAAGKAAKVLGESGWPYVTWILAAPFLSLLPIPIVSRLIGISPLAIKFLLGGQLERAIRDRSLQD